MILGMIARFSILFIISAFFLFSGCNDQGGRVNIPFGKAYDYSDILVKRAVDGDTLQLENGEKVRLIGIDTPEMHESDKLYRDSQRAKQDVEAIKEMGRQAYEFTKNLVEDKRVKLEFGVEKRDKYGRLLAYVFIPVYGTNWLQFIDGVVIKHQDLPLPVASSFSEKSMKGIYVVNLNAYIVQEGYASLLTIPPNVKYADLFLKLYQEARQNRRGLWRED